MLKYYDDEELIEYFHVSFIVTIISFFADICSYVVSLYHETDDLVLVVSAVVLSAAVSAFYYLVLIGIRTKQNRKGGSK